LNRPCESTSLDGYAKEPGCTDFLRIVTGMWSPGYRPTITNNQPDNLGASRGGGYGAVVGLVGNRFTKLDLQLSLLRTS
jgi:hypothetical protein